jgi:hypothetical protein
MLLHSVALAFLQLYVSHRHSIFSICRYPKLEESLRDIASSFRVNADGLNFSDQLFTFVEKD